jgi:phospholipid/cholesterol/gamma-HCH transport system permease protein
MAKRQPGEMRPYDLLPGVLRRARLVSEIGELAAIGLEGLRKTWDVRMWWRDYVDQCLFIAKVTVAPVMLVAIPLGATVALHVGGLMKQLGAQSATGGAVLLGILQQAAPVASALLIAGAGGSAMAADMGARNVRTELEAMEVMRVNPVHRLVTPRLWAAATVSVGLVSLVIVSALAGGFFFNVILQGVSPGSYFGNATEFLQLADLITALLKAFLFGIIAGVVACYRGMTCARTPAGVGISVKQSVVLTILLVFAVNYVVTSLYFVLVPQRF